MAVTKIEALPKALYDSLVSPNETDSNSEPANVVDGLFAIARALHRVAEAIEQHQKPANG